ncbi:hypothetical protein B9Z65_5194 [Elsinoe australis]|uniref:Glycosyltransferase family 34 protein n=1 Tax=Elsinoe australis TaxID=40998 RepID=A0A2P7ZDC8_9PEZI|nr:hypothetical protein B9Z65_5194 [Elsinoe australis]
MVALSPFPDQVAWGSTSSTRKFGRLLRYVVAPALLIFILVQAASHSSVKAPQSITKHFESLRHPSTYKAPVLHEDHSDSSDLENAADLLESTEYKDDEVHARIGKVTAVYYEKVSKKSKAYEAALLSHRDHDRKFNYPHYVLRRGVVAGLWSKQAYLLSILVAEMEKPASQRLDWLFWHDADVVLVNSNIPLEIFIPPEDKWSHVNFLITNDLNGMNDGIFFLRVCEWSIKFMAAGLAFESYNPDIHLRYDEQTALELLTREELWKNGTMHVPQRWFNAYHNYGTSDDIPPEWNWKLGYHQPGDLLVHLPGSADSRSALIKEWTGKIQEKPEMWNRPLKNTTYVEEIKTFWEEDAQNEEESQVVYWRRFHVLRKAGAEFDSKRDKAIKKYKESVKDDKDVTEDEINQQVEIIKEEHKKPKIEGLRKLYEDRLSGKEKDYAFAE